MSIWRIPITERFCGQKGVGRRASLMIVDGVGLIVYHDDDEEPTADYVRRTLIGLHHTFCLIEASTFEEALQEFGRLDEAKTGERAMALALDPDSPVEIAMRFPSCGLLHKSKEGRFICGEENTAEGSANGLYGMCVLEHYDPPERCPISQFLTAVYEEKDRIREKRGVDPDAPVVIKQYGGFRVALLKDEERL